MPDPRRATDRWVTPGVVCMFLFVVLVLVLATIAAVTYLQALGRDPEPMLKLVGQAVTAAGALGGFVLQLLGRATVTKVERNTNENTSALYEVADRVSDLEAASAGAGTRTMPPVPVPVPAR